MIKTKQNDDKSSLSLSLSIISMVSLWIMMTRMLVVVVDAKTANLPDVCGDCWCIYDGEYDSCPEPGEGIVKDIPMDSSNRIYATFELTNNPDFLKLQTPDGQPCFPFADAFDQPFERYPLSSLPQCAIPENPETSVCAYLYETGTSCEGRKYEIVTYSSIMEAELAGASVVHTGACGVCSSASDVWTRMSILGQFEDNGVICAVSYAFSSSPNRFDDLHQCYINMGLSNDCSLLWAHFSAVNAINCATACAPDPVTGEPILNGPAPACELAECFICSENFYPLSYSIGGFTLRGTGIIEDIARPCSSIANIIHDPCTGARPTPAPTGMPTTTPYPTIAPTVPQPMGPSSGGMKNNNNEKNYYLIVMFTLWFVMAILSRQII